MKKLLTMMVSCASALFAVADVTPLSGTNFESYGAEPNGAAIPLNINKDDAGGEAARYWYSATSTEGIVDAAVTNEGENAYLILDTSDVLQRTINSYAGGNFQSMAIGNNGIYFDSKVQFTATEDAPEPVQGDKLIVWLQAIEGSEGVEGSTNLVITAGNGIALDGSIIPGNFVVDSSSVAIEPNSWHRLTIKAFAEGEGDESVAFFNVYIDGSPVTGVLDEKQVTKFQSLIAPGIDDAATITSVGFKGTGAVDNVFFYDSDPLGFPVTVTIPFVDGADAIAKYSVDGSTWVDVIPGLPFTVPASTANITFKVSIAEGFELDEGDITDELHASGNPFWKRTVSVSKENNAITLTVVKAAEPEPETGAFSIDGVGSFATLAEAIAEATAGATIVVAKDADGNATSYNIEGIKIEKSIIINLNGNTLVLNKPAVGATEATQTLGIRIEGPEKSLINVTIMNGTIEISEENLRDDTGTDKQIKMMINNYANLTLTSVTLDGTNLVDPANDQPKYVLSNNRGNVLLDGTTSIIVPTTGTKGSVAFDVCKFQNYDVPTVTLRTAGTIGGDVEVTGGNFVYEAGTISGAINFSSGTIKGVAEKDITVVATGKVLDKNADDAWILVDKPADPETEVPTIGETEVKFDETGVITNITTAANGLVVSGVADTAAFLASFAKYYTVDIVGSQLSIALNDEAKPVIGEANVDDDEAKEPAIQIVNGQFKVTIQDSYEALKYKLQYKAGLGNDPETGKPYSWTDVATEEVGTGDAMQLSAPVSGDKGFYRVVVED